jgi:hypothetical protein
LRANHFTFAFMPDIARLARLERARQVAERRLRLGFPDARQVLKRIAQAEADARKSEPAPVRPLVVQKAVEITEVALKRATKALKEPWRWWK